MTGPNLSDWALKHRSFIVFAMISIVIAGLSSYSVSDATKIRFHLPHHDRAGGLARGNARRYLDPGNRALERSYRRQRAWISCALIPVRA